MIQIGEWSFAKFLDKPVQRMTLFLKNWSDEASLAESSFNNLFSLVQMDLGLPGLAKSLTEPVASKRLIRLATVCRFIDR
jgi:hypothetical protein